MKPAENLPHPYLIFVGDLQARINAKTGQGLVDWCPERCTGQLRLPGCRIDLGIPDMSLDEAKAAGVESLVIGIAPVGGNIKSEWVPLFVEALQKGLSIINGLHVQLAEIPAIRDALLKTTAKVYHLRTAPEQIPVGTGKKRTGKRVLMVGTDCGVGKKYSALALHRDLKRRGIKTTFRATGQTGILISGAGIPMDAVITDFISGAAELLSPDNDSDHWDVIEGQGALHHPGYGAVSLGILLGSQPDAFVLCHEATREKIDGFPGFFVGSLQQRIDEATYQGKLTNPAIRCVGVSVNTGWMSDEDPKSYLARISNQLQLPCVDPLSGDMNPIIDNLLSIE